MRRAAEILILVLWAAGALAQAPAERPSRTEQALRPTGPVTVTADRAEWEKSGAMLYAGNVSMSSSTLSMRGDRLELRQKDEGQYEAILTGAPARMDHAGVASSAGDDALPVSAQSRSLYYDSANALVQLSGGARLTRGTDEITGETIRYDVAARRIKATGGDGGQVRIVIQPPKPAAGKPPPP